jgi:hypothetical protein
MVLTGVSLLDVYGLGVAAGAGLDYVVGGGLLISTGSSINQFNGPFWDVSGPTCPVLIQGVKGAK